VILCLEFKQLLRTGMWKK